MAAREARDAAQAEAVRATQHATEVQVRFDGYQWLCDIRVER